MAEPDNTTNTHATSAEAATKQPKPWDEFIKTVLWALVIAVVFRSFLFEPFHIPSGSMKSNLLIGDYIFVSKYSYGYSRYSFPLGLPLFDGRIGSSHRPERGDVVVFRPPHKPRIDYIKRVIGLPGDTIKMDAGKLYINGEEIPQTYVDMFLDDDGVENDHKLIGRFEEVLPEGQKIQVLKENSLGYANNTQAYTVPEGHYFMMGDNRDNSRDSRFTSEVGMVPAENIVGRAEIIFLNVDPRYGLRQFWNWHESLDGDRFLQWIK